MSRTVSVTVQVEIDMIIRDDIDLDDIMSNMNWNFVPHSRHSDSVDIYGSGIDGNFKIIEDGNEDDDE